MTEDGESSGAPASAPANDAHLIQLVRGALGREELLRNGPRLNVSSCGMVVSLHGFVENAAHRERAEEVTSSVRGVEGVINKLRTP